MHPHDYGCRMRDSDVVAAVVAGDPEGLAKAYDKYAAPLYTYCRSLLHEPADAADAVQDTFVIAASRLAGLRDRDRLRPWLYAVARNECLHRIRARAGTSALEEAEDVTDESIDIGGDAERAELRTLLGAAAKGLNPAEQEVIELQLRQGLDPAEVADVLGISRNHAHALISRARDQLEICLGVLLVARTGREACAELDALLEGWDGQLTVLLRKRLHRHIDKCSICTDRKRSALRPAMLLGLAPLLALPATTTAPAELRDHVLRLASSSKPDAVAHRAAVAGRTGPFGQHGFPRPLSTPGAHWWHRRPVHVAAAVATAAAVTIAAVALSAGAHHQTAASGPAPGSRVGASLAQPGATAATSGGRATGQPGQGSRTGAGGLPGPTGQSGQTLPGQSTQPGQTEPGQSTEPSRGTSARPSPSVSGHSTSPASARTSPTLTRTSPAASKSASPAASPSATPARSAPPTTAASPGTLTVSPTTVLLTALGSSTLTIEAEGGPVSWSISEPVSLIGGVNLSATSGTLQAGQEATVSISVNGLASVDSTLTVNPGDHTVTVVLGLL
jgi:RNA polymerase sigma factor (sigma-70 family)